MIKVRSFNRISAISSIFLAHLIFSYNYLNGFYWSFVGFTLILILSIFVWRRSFLYWIGIPTNWRSIGIAFLIFMLFLTGSYINISRIAVSHEISMEAKNMKSFVHLFFYTLNEEIILGALLLKGMKKKWGKLKDEYISILVAAIFSILHFIFFKWIFTKSGNLHFTPLFTLFCIGLIRNNLILKTGHIAYAWAIHIAWIFIMLGFSHYSNADSKLSEFELFTTYLGHLKTLAYSVVLSVFSFIILKQKATFS